ncbi:MAG: hypothetical protein U0R80_06950 [Nocardioidaceae bacterium]
MVAALAALAALSACSTTSTGAAPDEETPSATTASGAATDEPAADDHEIEATRPRPLRPGERRLTLTMPESYTPSAPTGVGTDDYRCFLLDPHLRRSAYLTGTFVKPGNADVVHHVILFRVPPEQVAEAHALDDRTPGDGWTCFGNSGLGGGPGLDNAPWLGAWAPGGKEAVEAKGFGVELARGTQIVMQVHYNLLAGASPDTSSTLLRLAPASAHLTPIETVLLPAPVELPCRKAHADGPLCDRDAALADVTQRFGGAGATANLLHMLCGAEIHPGNVQSCTRTITQPTTIRAVAGHMHLLGRSITIVVNPGTPEERTVLDIPVWNFDDQGARPIAPVHLDPFDKVQVTCRHVQWLRDELPAFEGQPDRYVVWGEGTTDEMCLGILEVTRP